MAYIPMIIQEHIENGGDVLFRFERNGDPEVWEEYAEGLEGADDLLELFDADPDIVWMQAIRVLVSKVDPEHSYEQVGYERVRY